MAGSERIGDCDVLFELASGGMATILLARHAGDAGFERLVALKRVHRHLVQDPEVFAMASDEARLAALVRHANVVAVTGVLDAGGELVLLQEYVEGFGLARLLRELDKRGERLEPRIAARILIDAARGLHAAHEANDLMGEPLEIVHRDVSPQNLLVGTDGSTRLIDFGIARAERRMAMTRTGILKGKLSYMAPEQVGEAAVDRRADIFALGAVLFETLAGRRAFSGDDDASVMAKLLSAPPDTAPIAEVCPELAPVARRALAKRPEDRFATAQELGKAVAAAITPADEDDVKALVTRVFQDDLSRLRERIAAAIARVSTIDDDAAADEASDAPADSEPSRRAWLWPALGLAAGAALVAALALSSGSGDVGAHSGSTPVASSAALPPGSSLAAPSSHSATTASVEPSAHPTESAAIEPSASAARSAGPPKRTALPPSASVPKPDLHPSPYASSP